MSKIRTTLLFAPAAFFSAFLLGVCLSPSYARADNLVINGTFDNSFSGWTTIAVNGPNSLSISTASQCYQGATGNPAAAFNTYSGRIGALQQDIAMPSVTPATLSFRVWGQLDKTDVTVKIIEQNKTEHILETFTAPQLIDHYTFPGPVFICSGKTAVTKVYDISAYANQTITLRFESTSLGADGTFAILDDIEINTGGSSGTPGSGGDDDDDARRPTTTQIFCIRSGPTLETAKCSVSVADKGPFPKLLPTGSIDAIASGGFFPGAASCIPSQTALSPGIASCELTFAVPNGFPLGKKFPIDATYSGDANFQPSSTSHELISAGCVSVPGQTPCPDSIGLGFSSYPKILKQKIALYFGCGNGTAAAVAAAFGTSAAEEAPQPAGSCEVKGKLSADLKELFGKSEYEEIQELAKQLPADPKNDDAFDTAIREAAQMKKDRFQQMQQVQDKIFEITKSVQANNKKKVKKAFDGYIQEARSGTTKTKVKPDKALTTESIDLTVKANKQKLINLKLKPRLKHIAALFHKAGLQLPMTIEFKVRQAKRKGTVTLSQSLKVVP